jgi:hypothetical protein
MARRKRSTKPPDAARNGEPAAEAADPLQVDVKGDGRDPTTGRFKPGWRGGKGNPVHRRMAALRKAAVEAITSEQVKELIQHLHALALHQNMAAAKLVLAYCLGRPPDDPEDDDAEESSTEDQDQLLAETTA